MTDCSNSLQETQLEGYKQYRKKPILIEAKLMEEEFEIPTLEGLMTGKKGDYLVIGLEGECYPVKKEIFKKTFQFRCGICSQYHDVGELGKRH